MKLLSFFFDCVWSESAHRRERRSAATADAPRAGEHAARGARFDDEERRVVAAMWRDRARGGGVNGERRRTGLDGDDAAEDGAMELAEDGVESAGDFGHAAAGVGPTGGGVHEAFRIRHRPRAGGNPGEGLLESARGAMEMRGRFGQPERDQEELLRRRDGARRREASGRVDYARRGFDAPDTGIDGISAAAQGTGARPGMLPAQSSPARVARASPPRGVLHADRARHDFSTSGQTGGSDERISWGKESGVR